MGCGAAVDHREKVERPSRGAVAGMNGTIAMCASKGAKIYEVASTLTSRACFGSEVGYSGNRKSYFDSTARSARTVAMVAVK